MKVRKLWHPQFSQGGGQGVVEGVTVLRLTGQFEIKDFVPCPVCNGSGTVPQGPTLCVRMGINGSNWRGPIYVPGEGCPRPCPECEGKKVVPRGTESSALARHVRDADEHEEGSGTDGMY